jgi:hypothetical protein
MEKIQNVRMLILLATWSKETLTSWVNPKTVKMQRNQLTSKKQHKNHHWQQRIPSKRKSDSKKPLRAKRRKVEENNSDNSQSMQITPGDFVAVGLKPRKGPISVYIAEVTHVYEAECRLKYMKKSENAYVWPEKSDMSQELTENIISKLENPQLVNERGIFKFKTDELNNIKVDLMKIHKHVCFK